MVPPSVPPVADPPTLAALGELTRTVQGLVAMMAQRESAFSGSGDYTYYRYHYSSEARSGRGPYGPYAEGFSDDSGVLRAG